MNAIASQITGVSIVYPTVCSGVNQRKYQSSASLAFVREFTADRGLHKGPVTRKFFPFHDVIMMCLAHHQIRICVMFLRLPSFKRISIWNHIWKAVRKMQWQIYSTKLLLPITWPWHISYRMFWCWIRNISRELGQYHGYSWWRHQMETFSALLTLYAGNSPVTGEFPSQRPVMRSFDVFVDLRLKKPNQKKNRLSKQWFETPPRS